MLYSILPSLPLAILYQVSFNIDIDSIMAYASSMFNALMPIAAVGIGLSLGVGVIALLIRVVKGAISGIG